MKNRSFLVQFEHLKIQGGKLNGLAAWYFSCSIPRPRFMNFQFCCPPPPPPPSSLKLGLRAVHKFQPTFLKSVQRTGNEI